MSGDSLNFGPHNTNQNCSHFVQLIFTHMGDLSCNAQKGDADVEHFGRVKLVLLGYLGSSNFADPANIKKVHRELISQIRTEALNFNNK